MSLTAIIYAFAGALLCYKVVRFLLLGDPPLTGKDWI